MAELSPFGVLASAGSLRQGDGVLLPHVWTPEGVIARPAENGAQLLHLAIAFCILNDTYREAKRLDIPVAGVAVTADGGFDEDWRSIGITYALSIDSSGSAEDVEHLIAVVDEVAEIPKALRAGAEVARAD